ncbi:hypothetical protein [Hymenobacter volaticus]|uniref:Adhesin domain-containing protein n=1 Tax=Hymenobacter volaticus TaxID=2932254 RepID=A0ABY4G7W4_9BACT|nr:hypothetical protein [Hymenobacter volaticus]UOQ66579.1 hypothetical protein MUN86_01205 [Hymenobacter volaticus]
MSAVLLNIGKPRRWGEGLLLMLLYLAVLSSAQAQRKVQVLTRTIEQTLPCPTGTLVRIRAEKATLKVQGWDKPSVQVVLRLSARHPERAIAERELPAVRYQIAKKGNTIDLVNYFAVPVNAPPVRSDLRAEYIVMMPAANSLEIVNAYGRTELIDLTGRQTLVQDFGEIKLQDLRGSLEATIRYTELTSTNFNGAFVCRADKSAVQLTGAGGTYAISNAYGSVVFEPNDELKSAFVDATRTEVTIGVPQLSQYNYNLGSSQGKLVIPASYTSKRTLTGRNTLQVTNDAKLPLIRVNTSYAPITLQTQPLLIQR